MLVSKAAGLSEAAPNYFRRRESIENRSEPFSLVFGTLEPRTLSQFRYTKNSEGPAQTLARFTSVFTLASPEKQRCWFLELLISGV